AAAAVRAWSTDPANRYRSATSELNALGYRLLRAGRTDDALAVFRLNVRVHPVYANGWDSLGEGLVEAGRCEDALRAYRRALELDPRVGNAAEMVRRLVRRLGGGADAPTPVSCEMVRH
ncbi:MAG: BTAD domain-containing putative transcriptional regulator, partial [Gemmatimonadota bacterium]